MNIESFQEIQNNEIVRKRIAKLMARDCFRNTDLENFHDRFTQEEMKAITIKRRQYSKGVLNLLWIALAQFIMQ